MRTLFCVRPATRNIGNDVINRATADLIYGVFGDDAGIVNIPALKGLQYGGITARQVYDANRLADGVIIGGGNLFENGQLTVDSRALEALSTPMMLIGLSHGRVYSTGGSLIDRSDSMPEATVRQLVDRSQVSLVRDHATRSILHAFGCSGVQVGGCPTLFMEPNPAGHQDNGHVLISIRHPGKMSVAPSLQWRIAEDLRRLIATVQKEFSETVALVCHDYADLEFAAGFTGIPYLYFDDVERYIAALRHARVNIGYRLHAFLPCIAFGTPAVHLSYDERGEAMAATAQMTDWNVDLNREPNVMDVVMDRLRNLDLYPAALQNAAPGIGKLRDTTMTEMRRFADTVVAREDRI